MESIINSTQNKVDAIIIGAARAGTTTLASYLGAHPNIDFSKEKEVHFFAFDDLYKKGEKYINSFFKNNGKIKITADTYLLVDNIAPKIVLEYNPSMKFILIFREPVARAFSGYNYSLRNGYIKNGVNFIDACKQEKEFINSEDIVIKNNKCNLLRSSYFKSVKKWEQYFPKENFLILKTQDLHKNPTSVIKQIEDFINIENAELRLEEKIKNKAFSVRSKFLQQLLVNRNNPIRLFLKKILPPFVNKLLIKSGIVVKVANMNKQTKEYAKITEEEFRFAYKHLENDILNLKKEYNIDFS